MTGIYQGDEERVAARERRRELVLLRYGTECRLGSARTVGEVWRINEQLAEIDAALSAHTRRDR